MDSLDMLTATTTTPTTQPAPDPLVAEQTRIRRAMRIYATRSKNKLILPLVCRGRFVCVQPATAQAS